jgi:hypothetical protein
MFQGFGDIGCTRDRKAALLQYFAQRKTHQFIIINQQNLDQGHCVALVPLGALPWMESVSPGSSAPSY